MRTAERRSKDEEAQRQLQETERKERQERQTRCEVPEEIGETTNTVDDGDDGDFSLQEEQEEGGKKRKLSFVETLGATHKDIPPNWSPLRISHHKVRPEYYRVVDILVAKHHCSVDQAVAAVVEVGRGLFQLPWKFHKDADEMDLDTAPHRQSQRLSSKAIEAHTLAKIAQKITEAPSNATVTLHDDGSRAQGCGG